MRHEVLAAAAYAARYAPLLCRHVISFFIAVISFTFSLIFHAEPPPASFTMALLPRFSFIALDYFELLKCASEAPAAV